MKGEPLPPVDETKSRRYRCATCWDEGVVRVWHPRTVAMVRKLIDDGKEWTGHAGVYDAVAACSCSLGDSWCNRTAKGNESRTFLPRYSPQNFCRLLTSTANEADRDRLWDWVQLWKPANFTPAFSEWNSQGELV
jgi:hypothetical protein